MKNIVAAIDFSDAAEAALAAAESFAKTHGARLTVAHIAAPDPDFIGFEAGPQYIRDSRAATLKAEHAQLGKIGERIRESGIETVPVLREGPTVHTLLEQIAKPKDDLVVMGSHGHGALYNLVVGSVAQGVLKGAKVPVLIVPAKR